ncbi:MAG: hypothetical protein EVJ47_06445 [Candidatus Acidulodesulfobacterium ferriphilum]|uniref:Uncharacterized protein n=1 Tax=Candidatus Acidulodesulfobacterium ferriphilum TaxID=2597223 RepID=A0A519BAI9_9DELT|nr:MAG: hypothetical protein EVJ47_06445 [Candidatus Acidulodesulfobacterium ferriphilum]
MKRIILFLALFVLAIPSLASAKVVFNVGHTNSKNIPEKSIEHQTAYELFHNKKLTNIQRADNSGKDYTFIISTTGKNANGVYFVTASVFVTHTYHDTEEWDAIYGGTIPDRKLKSIFKNDTLSQAELQANYFAVDKAISIANKDYYIWK